MKYLKFAKESIAMNIMTFNIQHCMVHKRGDIDFKLYADTISRFSPDIVSMNEVRNESADAEYENQPKILSELTGIKYHYFAETLKFDGVNPYGNAILTKYPIISAEIIPIPDPVTHAYNGYYETRNILKVKLDCGLTVMVTHWGLNRDEQINAQKTVLENLDSEKCILMGDFNVDYTNDLLEPIRAKMFDTAKLFSEPLLSYPSDNPIDKRDYIFTTPDIKVLSADIPPIVVSDHRPYVAKIEF